MQNKVPLAIKATIVPHHIHGIPQNKISENAIKVLYRLIESGYDAYLVGGCVRDLILGQKPKDFDIVTNALPDEIKACFRNGRLIGRRFRLVHVLFKNEIIEVSTFRGEPNEDLRERTHSNTGMIVRDNVYGSLEEDAFRRDFTINAFYYNLLDSTVLDFHGGMEDISQGQIRIIGNPEARYQEDPVRILRGIRLAARLGFNFIEETEEPLMNLGHLLSIVSPHRLFNEVLKLFLDTSALTAFKLLRSYQLLKYLFPETERCILENKPENTLTFITQALSDTDTRLKSGKTVSPGYLIAVLLWPPIQRYLLDYLQQHMHFFPALNLAMHDVNHKQQRAVNIPKNFGYTAQTIWDLQYRLEKRQRSKCYDIISHPRFRAAYDFLELRSRTGENTQALYQWWTEFYESEHKEQQNMLKRLSSRKRKKKKHGAH